MNVATISALAVGVAVIAVAIWLVLHYSRSLAHPPEEPNLDGSDLRGERPPHDPLVSRDDLQELYDRLTQSVYIKRRVERLQFQGTLRYQRQTSLDVVVSKAGWIPIGLYAKDPNIKTQVGVRAFSLRDSTGRALSLMGRRENSRLLYDVLVHATRSICSEYLRRRGSEDISVDLTPEEEQLLWAVSAQTIQEAEPLLREVGTLIDAAAEAFSVSGSDPDRLRDALAQSGSYGRVLAAAYSSWNTFWPLLRRLGASWVMMTYIREEEIDASRPALEVTTSEEKRAYSSRTIVKATHDDYYYRFYPKERYNIGGSLFWKLLGWGAVPFRITSRTSLPCESLHLEIVAPPGISLNGLLLAKHSTADPEYRQVAIDSELPAHSGVAHTYVPQVRSTNTLSAAAWFRIQNSARLVATIFASALLAGIAGWGAVDEKLLSSIDSEILLLVPGLVIGALLVQQHEVVSIYSQHLRSMLSALVVLAVLSAVAAAGLNGDVRSWALGLIAVFAAGFTILQVPVVVQRGSRDLPQALEREMHPAQDAQ